jgi:DNA-binding response OmpR family regulator
VITRSAIADQIWDGEFDAYSNIIDVYINRLRKKIDHGFSSPMIQTRRSEGYVFN